MSFILDALRKSENARQRHGGPGFAEVPVARRKETRPWWIVAVAALLLVNLGVLLFVLTRSPATVEPEAAPPASAAVPPAATPAPAAPPTVPMQPTAPTTPPAAASVPAPSGRSLAEEAAGGADLNARDIDAPQNQQAAAVPQRSPIVRPMNEPPAPAPEENLPTINELTGDRAANMPAMHIDIHVHSPNAAERFVFINMKRYNEGDTLAEGPLLERITPEGVVLNQRGFRFILPRQ